MSKEALYCIHTAIIVVGCTIDVCIFYRAEKIHIAKTARSKPDLKILPDLKICFFIVKLLESWACARFINMVSVTSPNLKYSARPTAVVVS